MAEKYIQVISIPCGSSKVCNCRQGKETFLSSKRLLLEGEVAFFPKFANGMLNFINILKMSCRYGIRVALLKAEDR